MRVVSPAALAKPDQRHKNAGQEQRYDQQNTRIEHSRLRRGILFHKEELTSPAHVKSRKTSPLFEVSRVLMGFDHVARFIVNPKLPSRNLAP
jgi:hypothetical protein